MIATPPAASVIVPAHDEAAVIGNLLDALAGTGDGAGATAARLEIIVVCNGCSDDTAAVARGYPDVNVIELVEASKRLALEAGDRVATAFPRIYLDADVEMSRASLDRLVEALRSGEWHAAAPERVIPREAVGRLVGWYYDVWEHLPQVRDGLFGRGVIALSAPGNGRVRALPPSMGDDLVASEAFATHECTVVRDAFVTVHPPRTLGDLQRRRVRAVTGNAQADQHGLRRSTSITSWRTMVEMARRHPRLVPRFPVFLAVTAGSRVAARGAIRTGDFQTWLRDESSRARD